VICGGPQGEAVDVDLGGPVLAQGRGRPVGSFGHVAGGEASLAGDLAAGLGRFDGPQEVEAYGESANWI
jgi:hypothetical protein